MKMNHNLKPEGLIYIHKGQEVLAGLLALCYKYFHENNGKNFKGNLQQIKNRLIPPCKGTTVQIVLDDLRRKGILIQYTSSKYPTYELDFKELLKLILDIPFSDSVRLIVEFEFSKHSNFALRRPEDLTRALNVLSKRFPKTK